MRKTRHTGFAVNNKISLPMTRMTFLANRGLVQRKPASSVHVDKGLENQRVRTSASIPALVPLLAVLVAALPVLAHENFSASLATITNFSISEWVSEVRAALKSDVRM